MRQYLFIALAGLSLARCAHVNEKLDEKVAAESNVKTVEDLNRETTRELNVAPGITPEQKTALLKLREQIQATDRETWQEMLKLRAVLVKDMLAPNYNQAEVNRIQRRMRSLENKRLSMQFKAIDQANEILGRKFQDAKQLNDLLFLEPRPY